MISGMEAFNATAREVAATAGVPFIDFADAVPRTSAHFTDDVHMTKRANAILAERAADAIVAARLIETAVAGAAPAKPSAGR